ncbi:M15 family metallopeptidase [Georgenia yuyongxinii]|uniref:D-alanyl-D-alanine carboxypeptidase-like core domain-containing protein n=1 Tax=Georgenia yuyongxinii TaxID=2589797 RepID=A0A552WLI0_9MICO|nr:M15 family metallopeptidase [Georgenia yuyongxinii]TRW43596.1 hypothetical protein FJ693_17055 [Georgenia yuyongxinii]
MKLRRTGTTAAVALLVTGTMVTGATGAAAKGQSDGWGNDFYLSDTFAAQASTVFTYGEITDYFYVGDWDGDGVDTLAYRRGATFFVRNSNTTGAPEHSFTYGRAGDTVLVGDWDGDGVDTLAVRRGAEYHVKNALTAGRADVVAVYGRDDDTVLIGDWDGNGTDTFAVRRGAAYHVKNTISAGAADRVAVYGRSDDDVYVGDFDGDGDDSFTVRRGAQYFVANEIRAGQADRTVVYGRSTDTTLVGDWNGDGVDSLGIQRLRPALERTANGSVTNLAGVDAVSGDHDARNGRLSHALLCPIPFLPTHAIQCRAVDDLVAFHRAYEARFGKPLPINGAPFTTYRSYADQLHVWQETGPPVAARPGTSPHGYGLAVDFGGKTEIEFGQEPYPWLRANGPRFGWYNMPWHWETGSVPEPWHFDYRR